MRFVTGKGKVKGKRFSNTMATPTKAKQSTFSRLSPKRGGGKKIAAEGKVRPSEECKATSEDIERSELPNASLCDKAIPLTCRFASRLVHRRASRNRA